MRAALLLEQPLIASALEDAAVAGIAIAFVDGLAIVPELGKISKIVGGGVRRRRFHASTALGLARSLSIATLAAARLGALPVCLPEAFAVADLGDIVGCVAPRLSRGAFDLLVAVSVTGRTDVAGTGLVTSLDGLPSMAAAQHYCSVRSVTLVCTEWTIGEGEGEGCRQ